jgi:hypothetical protein
MMLRWITDIDEMLARVTIGCMHADAEERVSTIKGLNTSTILPRRQMSTMKAHQMPGR